MMQARENRGGLHDRSPEAARSEASVWFPELLARRAVSQPDKLAYRFLRGTSPPQTLSFAELHALASGLAARLAQRGWRRERALLVCKSERNFVVAFYACLLAGVIAVPTAPPRRQALLQRLQLLVVDSGAVAVLCDFDEILQAPLVVGGKGLCMLDVRAAGDVAAGSVSFDPASVAGPDLAFLQYTSGSTGEPKGVAVSHANLVDNSELIRRAMALSASSSVLIGLPLFHDMGLVGGVFQSMYVGCSSSFMSPAELVQYPERWLQLISTLRITASGGPNFMYELAVNDVRDEHLPGLDLSSWRVAFCGAEPVRASTMQRFVDRFSRAGFDPAAFFPCYGMAEATLFIAGGPAGRPPEVVRRNGLDVVCCGNPAGGLQLRIVDPETRNPLADGAVGEIWVSGASVGQGYWGRAALSEQSFRAEVRGEEGTRYLRTGDLGWLQDGRLYLCGRLKDVIIVSGRKHAPHDLEETVEASGAGVRSGAVIAFGVQRAEAAEALVIVAELARQAVRQVDDWGRRAALIRSAVHAAHGLPVADVVFLKPGQLPRTSSGKVRRSQCRDDYVQGRFTSAAEQPVA